MTPLDAPDAEVDASPDAPLLLARFLPYRLAVLSARVSAMIARDYAQAHDLTVPQWRVIAVLCERPGLTHTAVGDMTRMDKASVSRTVSSLVERGLVARATCPEDGRAAVLTPTPAGRALFADVAPKARAHEARVLEGLSAADRDALERVLARLEAHVATIDTD